MVMTTDIIPTINPILAGCPSGEFNCALVYVEVIIVSASLLPYQ